MTQPHKLRFRFSLRTLMMLIAACAFWLKIQVDWIRQRHDLLDEGRVSSFGKYTGSFDAGCTAPWSLRLLGESGVKCVSVRMHDGDDSSKSEQLVQELFPEARVGLFWPFISLQDVKVFEFAAGGSIDGNIDQ